MTVSGLAYNFFNHSVHSQGKNEPEHINQCCPLPKKKWTRAHRFCLGSIYYLPPPPFQRFNEVGYIALQMTELT